MLLRVALLQGGLILIVTCLSNLIGISQPTSYKFDFGNEKTRKNFIPVKSTTYYSKETGYGFLRGTDLDANGYTGYDAMLSDYITSEKPFYFTVDVPEGNYNVVVYLGDAKGTSSTTIRAECRRLMLEEITTHTGEITRQEFTVHVRKPMIAPGTDSVRLKPREFNYLHWDGQLTLEFNGKNPKVCGVEISKTTKPVTVFLAGNSTVVDQAEEPYASWGQMIPAFFKPGKIVFANYAESGESLKSFMGENRLKKILSMIKAGDYLFIEFAHNDQKAGSNFLKPFTTYKETLKYYISETRKRKANPVLVTSMHRRKFDLQGKIINTLEDYPEAVRQTGLEERVPVIDLNAMSKTLYEVWGPEKSKLAFVHYPAGTFPGQVNELKDDTHFNAYGAYELAKCVIEGIRSNKLDIERELKSNYNMFNPMNPDPVEKFWWPLSPGRNAGIRPDGN